MFTYVWRAPYAGSNIAKEWNYNANFNRKYAQECLESGDSISMRFCLDVVASLSVTVDEVIPGSEEEL